MKLVFISNFFNHHVKFISDVLFHILGGDYCFVETMDMPAEQRSLGYHSYEVPYLIKYNETNRLYVDKIIMDADVVQIGQAPLSMVKKRIISGKMVTVYSERRYKSLIKYFKWPFYTYKSLFFNRCYLLAAGAYASKDFFLSGMSADRCFKFGYFPELVRYEEKSLLSRKRKVREDNAVDVTILWTGRLIGWKHPETIVRVALFLKNQNVKFKINVIGTGPLFPSLLKTIKENNLTDSVCMLGSMRPEKVRKFMEDTDVFLSTSDYNEGWGATVNESMNSACAIVASSGIGSVPYLVKDGINGLIFHSKNWKELCDKVLLLSRNNLMREELGINAYRTIVDVWNPVVAGERLVSLYKCLMCGEDTPFQDGPCSKATLYW